MIHGLTGNLAEGPVRRAKFHFARARGIFGDFRPKKHENLPKKFQSCKLLRPAGANPSPDFSEVYALYARNQFTQGVTI